MTQEKTKGWFSKLSKTKKVLLIGGAIALIGTGIGIYIYRNRKNEQEETKVTTQKEDKNAAPEKEDDSTSRLSAIQEPYKGNLPKDGKGCEDVKHNFDRDFFYVKCDGAWYAKSKSNPITPSLKERYKDWTNIESNKVAVERLTRRYG